MPTWSQVGFQNRAKSDKKPIEKLIKKLMHVGIDFLKDFDGFWEGKWKQVGNKMGSEPKTRTQLRKRNKSQTATAKARLSLGLSLLATLSS